MPLQKKTLSSESNMELIEKEDYLPGLNLKLNPKGFYYLAQPYTYNPEEAYKLAKQYRNYTVDNKMFNYSPICETHSPHAEYLELLKDNFMDVEEIEKNLYTYYVAEDIYKMELFRKGSTPEQPFALLMGYGWNLRLPFHHNVKNLDLDELMNQYFKYEFDATKKVKMLSSGAVNEWVWAMENAIPCYELGPLMMENRLIPAILEVIYYKEDFTRLITGEMIE